VKVSTRLRRLARQAIASIGRAVGFRQYAGARVNRLLPNIPPGTDANREIMSSLPMLRNRSRELVRDDALASGLIATSVRNLVGTGVHPKPQVRIAPANQSKGAIDRAAKQERELEGILESTWREWAAGDCDAAGLGRPLATLLSIATHTWKESGGCLIRLRWRRTSDKLVVPFQLQLLETDYIDMTADYPPDQSGDYWIQGVKFNALDRVIAYRLFVQHPGSGWAWAPGSILYNDVSANDIVYLTSTTRAGQVHGVPLLTPVIASLIQRQRFIRSEMTRQETMSRMAVVVTPGNDAVNLDDETIGLQVGTSESPAEAASSGRAPVYESEIPEGGILIARNGKTVTPIIPASNSQYDVFCRRTDRDICAGAGVPYELGTGDFSQISYSSYKAGEIQFRESIRVDQRIWLTPACLQPIWRRFLLAAELAGKIPAGLDIRVSWHFPAVADTSRKESIEAKVAAIAGGLSSYSIELAQDGIDFEDVCRQRCKDDAMLAECGIVPVLQPGQQPALDTAEKTTQPVTGSAEP